LRVVSKSAALNSAFTLSKIFAAAKAEASSYAADFNPFTATLSPSTTIVPFALSLASLSVVIN
jgi:hypothetical protein